MSVRSLSRNVNAGEYANLPLLPPYLDPQNDLYDYGANFASGGGGALALSHQEQVPIKSIKPISFPFFSSAETNAFVWFSGHWASNSAEVFQKGGEIIKKEAGKCKIPKLPL